jgi:signal transduction histidine kinase
MGRSEDSVLASADRAASGARGSDTPTSATLMALKFELAMSIGESLELAPMARRFMVPLLQAVQGSHCLLWLRADSGPAQRLAYPQRSLQLWEEGSPRQRWLAQTVAMELPAAQQQMDGEHHRHALPVADEGWLVIERTGGPIHPAVLDAIAVVLRRLARACRACHEFARARQLLAEKEAAERAMAEAHSRMAEIFSLCSDGFAYFDTQNRLAYFNPAVEALLGLPASRLRGCTLADLDQHLAASKRVGVDGHDNTALAERVAQLGRAASCSGLLTLHDQRQRILAYTLSRTDDDRHAVLYLRDVTRETEVDRMKSEFLSTAAHELRTPMVSVFGFTELLLRRPVTEARRKDMLETIHRQASLLINMVNELLDLARIEARQGKDLKREACRIDSLITKAVGPLVGNSARHQIVVDIPHGDSVLWVDPEKTHRALTNVLSNAIKYSPAGGRIDVCTQAGQLRGEPAVGLTVSDAGIGMSAEQLARVFERFYRADPSGNIPGTGLGMSLVKEIVELQGGRVDIASQPGAGTTVTMWLPLSGLPDNPARPRGAQPLLGHDAEAAAGKA